MNFLLAQFAANSKRINPVCRLMLLLLFLALPAVVRADFTWFTYTTSGNNANITGYDSNGPLTMSLNIPATINGYQVTSIGYHAFQGKRWITGVTIPASVTTIGEGAFDDTGLTSVTIPCSVTSIGGDAFDACSSLASATFLGNAPAMGGGVFDATSGSFTAHYFFNASGFTSPTWDGYPSSMMPVTPNVTNPTSATIDYNTATLGGNVTSDGGATISACGVVFAPTAINNNPQLGGSGVTNVTATGTSGVFTINVSSLIPGTNYTFAAYASSSVGTGYSTTGSFATPTRYIYTTSNGAITITGYIEPGGAITIPSAINGTPVTTIGIDAFNNHRSITSITIPSSVTSIGIDAFYSCTGLTSVTIPASVTSIGEDAFSGCTGLTSIAVDAANATYCSVDGVLFNKSATTLIQFPAGKAGDYTIPVSVTSIWNYAFTGNTSLTSVTIPSSVISIGEGALMGCSILTGVTIPSGVTSIGSEAFLGCSGLTSIAVDAANATYCSVDGVLFNKSATTLIQFPAGKGGDYTIPDSVTSIGISAFLNCTGLAAVTIPDSVTSIGDYAFYQCTGLTRVIFAGNAPTMGAYVFLGTASGFTVDYYNGASGFTTPTWDGYPSSMTPVTPTVTTPTSANITATTATLGGNVNANGVATVTAIGVVCSPTLTNSNPQIGGTGVTNVTGTGMGGAFSVNASGLMPNTTYTFAAYATNSVATSYSITGIFTTAAALPTVTTPTCTNIKSTTATLGGSVTSDGGATINMCGVVYSQTAINPNPQISGNGVGMVNYGATTGVFTVSAINLMPGTAYSYAAFATNSVGTSYSPVGTFTTTAAPTVTSPTYTNVTETAARLGGNVTSNGGATISLRGVVISPTLTNSNPLIGGTGVTNVTGTGTNGVFTVNVNNLTPGTNYSFRAYATNSVGAGYSAAIIFTTAAAPPTVTTPTVTNITAITATLGGNVTSQQGADITARGIVCAPTAINANPQIGGTGVFYVGTSGHTGVFTVHEDGLTPSTAYTFAAFATNRAGTGYSVTGSFTTLSNNANISNLALSVGTLNPIFTSSTTDYTASVANAATSVTATPTVTDLTATIKVNGTSIASGTTSPAIPLVVGANTITIVVTAQDGTTTKTYTVTVTRLVNPAVSSAASTSITSSSAMLGGNVTSDGGASITALGVVYAPTATNSNPQIGGTGVTNVTGTGTTGVFMVSASGLIAGTAYTFAAYATNSEGTSYSAVGTFTTLMPFTYTTSGGSVTITGYTGSGGAESIPATIDGNQVTSIRNSAFSGCTSLTGITIPASVTSIGVEAFYNCTNLTGVTIPASVTSIGYIPFVGCTNLVAITVDAANPSYSSAGGILFDKCETTLLECPAGIIGIYSIPSGVTTIGDAAFYGCTSLTSVTIPASVNSIGQWAFYECSSLTTATFSGNAPTMESGAFDFAVTGFTVDYYSGATGFTSPTWKGYATSNLGVSPIAVWLVSHGFPTSANLQSVPNGDGVSLLMACALNLDPNRNQSANLPKPERSANQMSLTFYAGNTNVTYTVQSSTDLKTWSGTGVSISAPDGNNNRTATMTISDSCRYRFMRLVVSH